MPGLICESGAVIRVQRATPDHWRLWRELRLRALEESPEAFASTLAGTLARDAAEGESYWQGFFTAAGLVLVARCGDEPAGMARLVDPGDEQPLELFSLWVAPEARGRGVGEALIAECLGWAAAHRPRAAMRLAVVETNAPARRLYERCGFGVIGRNPDDDAELLMERGPDR